MISAVIDPFWNLAIGNDPRTSPIPDDDHPSEIEARQPVTPEDL
jgi:hypothetical protein